MKGWETAMLGDTCDMYQPKTISMKDLVEDGAYLVYGANGVIGRYDKFNHDDPQLIITCRGATCGSVNVSSPKSWITGNAMVVRPRDDSIDLRFLEYLFRGGIDISRAITGAAQPQITRTNLAPLEITYPSSVEEQRRIVGILDEAFEGIATARANAEKNLQNARALFESHLQSVFSQRGDEWVERRLGDVVTRLTNGYVGPTRNIYQESGVPYLLARHVKSNRLLFDGKTFISDEFNRKNKKSMLKAGDVLLVQSGHIGHSAVVTPEHEGHNCHAMIVITPVRESATGPFLSMYFNSSEMRQRFDEIRSGSTVPHLTCREVKELMIALPDISTQHLLVDRSKELQVETQKLESVYQRKLATLEALKKSLLDQAFTGRL